MQKYHGKYRIPSARLHNWDYRRPSAYFITICTHNREHYFGKIVRPSKYSSPQMQLNPVGAIADVLWHEIKNHTTNMELDAFIVMPNHIHGILILTGTESTEMADTGSTEMADTGSGAVQTLHATSLPHATPPLMDSLQTLHATSLPPHIAPLQSPTKTPNQFMSEISPTPDSVSTIIRSYKSAVTKHAHRLGFNFEWHPRFYDHIIRDEQSYQRIRHYIISNPEKWNNDKFYCK